MRSARAIALSVILSVVLHTMMSLVGYAIGRFSGGGGDAALDPDATEAKKTPGASEFIRVVDIEPPVFEEVPEDARYAGLFDASPAKETAPAASARGAHGGGVPDAAPSTRPPDSPPAPRPPALGAGGDGARRDDAGDDRVSPLTMPEYRSLGVGSLKLSLDTRDAGDRDGVPDGGKPGPAPGAPGKPGVPGSPTLMPGPTEAGIEHEYLPDVAEGPGKLIKTKHYKFAGFFLRLKNDVERKWHARDAYVRHDPTGEVYGVKDRYTQLYVKLTKEGHVVDVAVAVSSGLDFLDTEAMSAIKNAEPFHHPPPGLADDDGYIRFYFGFYLYVSEPPRVNVFHY